MNEEYTLERMYRDMHSRQQFLGKTWLAHEERFFTFLHETIPEAQRCVLDYGCGPFGGIDDHKEVGLKVIPYDPYVTAYETPPWNEQFNAVFSCDVLEHLPIDQIASLLLRLRKYHSKDVECMYFSVSCRPANKSLPNGLNAHLTVHPPSWWHGLFLGAFFGHYKITIAEYDFITDTAFFGLVRG